MSSSLDFSTEPHSIALSREILRVMAEMDDRLAGSALQLSSVRHTAYRRLAVELACTLYGRDVGKPADLPAEPGDYLSVDVPDPDYPPEMPATWWDHLLADLSCFIRRWTLRMVSRLKHPHCGLLGCPVVPLSSLVDWLDACVKRRVLAVVVKSRRIQVTRRLQTRLVCPHIGSAIPADRHHAFLAQYGSPDDPHRHYLFHAVMALIDRERDAIACGGPDCPRVLHELRSLIDVYASAPGNPPRMVV